MSPEATARLVASGQESAEVGEADLPGAGRVEERTASWATRIDPERLREVGWDGVSMSL